MCRCLLLDFSLLLDTLQTIGCTRMNVLSANDGTWHMCYRSIIPRSLSGNLPSLDIVSVGSVDSTDVP
jgi:hypothetical protein